MRDPELTKRAKQMRRDPTEPELRLWTVLRAKRFGGIKTHAVSKGYDVARSRELEQLGYRVIRFNNRDVMENLQGVAIELDRFIYTAPLPTLSPEGKRAL